MGEQRRAKAEGEVDIRTVPGAGRDLKPDERRGDGGGGEATASQAGAPPEARKPPPLGIEGP